MYAKWQPLPDDVKDKPFTLGDGVNTGINSFELKNSELFDALNIDSRLYPALKVRDGRTLYGSVTTPNMLGQRNNSYLHALDGGNWKYLDGSWVTIASGLTSAMARVEDFATGTTRYTIFSNGTNRKQWDGTTVTDLAGMPATNKFISHKGRVYALRDNDIVFCALNKINDWTTANDSGTIDITNAKGPGTAITSFGNHILAFTNYSTHELYGTGPSNYSLIDLSLEIGCVSDRTPIDVGGKLYWLGRNHVYKYTGGTRPQSVSFKVDRYINNINWAYAYKACAGTDGRRYYLSIPTNGSSVNNLLLVYDTEFETDKSDGNWYVEDSNFVDFTEFSNKFYGVTSDGKIKNMFGAETDDGVNISWFALTKVLYENNLGERKSLKELNLIIHLRSGSTLQCLASTDPEGENFTLVKEFTPTTDLVNERIIIPMNVAHNADWIRIKFVGTGKCTIHEVERRLRIIRRG